MIHNQTPEEVAADLEAAADIVRVNGLNKGDYWPGADGGRDAGAEYQPGFPVCAYGAVAVARGLVQSPQVDSCPATQVIERKLGHGLVNWNDDRETTADDLVELMLGAAKDLRNGVIDADGNLV